MHLEVLYVEDNPADVFFLAEAMRRIDPVLSLTTVSDGEAAIAFLQSTLGKPCVIVLDLGLPRIDGVHVFQAIKSIPHFAHVPVAVFAGEAGRRKILDTGNAPDVFLTKPMDLKGYGVIAEQIVDLCLSKA